ncbi:AbrB/MazE/SpoVT family DNA-binding domain-containing protein [Komagataeibacter saccharivorans]|uniref:AbrB/MazE/SpoVT family DNA-binding domain-containing protein n=1 Tax=Komagataeibacter saccharivorans TaxID=265959 RepID=UPI0039E861E2
MQTSDHDIAAPAGRTAIPLFRWDSSIAIRMPSHIARQSGLQEGDTVGAVFSP